jgi:hypothetical protein
LPLYIFTTLALLFVLGQPRSALAQQWKTLPGDDISNTNRGYVGIGTESPGSTLHVKGVITVGPSGPSELEILRMFDPTNKGLRWSITNSTSGFFGITQRDINWTDQGTRLIIDRRGNVGIGTLSPTDKLELNGNVTNGATLTVSTAGNARYRTGTLGTKVPNWGGQFINVKFNEGAANWTLDDTGLHAGFLKFDLRNAPYGNEIGLYRMAAGANPRPDSAWTPIAQFKLDTGNILLATSSGNVGIGTTNPTRKLDVAGNVNASGGLCIAGDCRTAWSQVGNQWSTSGQDLYAAVNVGIGRPTPAYKLDVWEARANAYAARISQVNTTGSNGLLIQTRTATAADAALSVFSDAGNILGLSVRNNGNVGIGTSAPAAMLHVAGDVKVEGNLTAKNQDVAEWVASTQKLSAGMVVALDPGRTNHVVASASAYDTRVAGVISARPGITLGEAGAGKVTVATTGRVRVKVDATRRPIHIGDLLVTSDRAGLAMPSVPVEVGGVRMHRPGTVIGKALEPLAGGVGEILVLLSLQ